MKAAEWEGSSGKRREGGGDGTVESGFEGALSHCIDFRVCNLFIDKTTTNFCNLSSPFITMKPIGLCFPAIVYPFGREENITATKADLMDH